MASGTISLGTSGNLAARIKWTATANGTAANTSTVKVTVQVARASGSSYTTGGTFKGSVTVGSTTKSISKYAECSTTYVTIYTLSITKAHNNDGTGTCYIAGTVKGPTGTTMEGKTVSNSATVTLDRIPRGATITSAPNFNDEANPTISYSNPVGSGVSSLEACISLTGAKADVPYRAISKTGTSYTFNLTDAERETLRAATTTSNSRTVRFYVQTVLGEQTLRNNVEKTLTIVNAAPTLTATVTDSNAATVALTGDPNVLVKYYSKASASATYAALKEASVSSYSVTNGGKSLSTIPATFSAVESGEFKFAVTDSRGNTTTKTVTKTLVNYVKLSCNLGDEKPDAEGNFTLRASGNYFNGSFGAVDNTLSVQYRHKEQSGEWSEWVAMTTTPSDNAYTAEAEITGLDYRLTHVFQVKAADKVCDCYSVERAVNVFPLFDWGDTDFAFNIPVYLNGGAFDADGNAIAGVDADANTPVLLWENASPSSEFAAQSVSADPRGYRFLYIRFQPATDSVYHTNKLVKVGSGEYDRIVVVNYPDSGFYCGYRAINAQTTANKVYFGNFSGLQYASGAWKVLSADKTKGIPTHIYGIK